MRLLPWLVLVISLVSATTADARLFWQTYGSTVPASDGYGCTWNWNQDYFVPRHPSSCRYGLYSPCKSSCTTSPACKRSHPFYPGYCTIYGPCHYRRRDHVYGAYCGCKPIESCGQYCGAAPATSCCSAGASIGARCGEPLTPLYAEAPLHHVEPSQLDILGSIPVEGGDLLTRTDFSQLSNERDGQLLLQPQGVLPTFQGLPSLRSPASGQLNQP